MIFLLIKWFALALAVMFVAWVVPGIRVANFTSALWVCVVIGIINIFIRPLVMLITLPINLLTLGLFTFVVNALLLMLAGFLVPSFSVNGFLSALFGSILLSIISLGIDRIG
jgi:putative membrane protein